MLKSRNRLLTFRLSLEEYEMVRRVSAASNARSISDFARDALLERAVLSASEHHSFPTNLEGLCGRLQALQKLLRDMQEQITKLLSSD